MHTLYGDFHVHLGRSADGRPIKITAARGLTLEAALREGQQRKGLDLMGIVDAACPPVLADLERLIEAGELEELAGGGFRFRGGLVFLAGAEVETEELRGPAHFLAFFPTLEALKHFSRRLAGWVTNPNLSSQHCRCRAADILEAVTALEGVFLPAHAFTPHKGLFGQGVDDLAEAFTDRQIAQIPAMELGLSSDTALADRIPGLGSFTFLSNSDAHSLPKIAREYNALELAEANFREWEMALRRREGRRVAANYGLDPRLGKYHRSACALCETIAEVPAPFFGPCARCGAAQLTPGVLDRIELLAQHGDRPLCPNRPPYIHQVPLEFLPGIGPKAMQRLLDRFGTEMNLLHRATDEEIAAAAGPKLAKILLAHRRGDIDWVHGGGGRFGRVAVRND
ncbi:TIGR00375 family protein [Heliobacterium undosum]|uniref:TIGR00375 family protein n=1 Tax=Heliomicrobium undosum TaxID=121734 RepID=A0A845L683_9FIRM|nr:endonuclease Q family protein [Heliomicrobium undosum]MZP28431.1 TIGR00375 family protein [Heliomicrobium undosum]